MDQTFKNQSSIRAAQNWLTGALRMRHQAGDIPLLVADAGDVVERAVGISGLGCLSLGVRIAPEDLVVRPELRQCPLVREIAAFAVCDRETQKFVAGNLAGERRISGDRFEENVFATELERAVANERARQQAGFAEDLETVADAQHRPAIG